MQIGAADLERKLNQAKSFLESGEQVQVQVFLKGRQKANPERAVDFLEAKVCSFLKESGKQANQPNLQRLSVTFNPIKK